MGVGQVSGAQIAPPDSPSVRSNSDSERPVLETETFEPESLDSDDVTDAGPGCTCDHVGFLFYRQLGNEGLRLGQGICPATRTGDIC